ncbi:MAG: Hsp20/alpha crystallin family protein [Methanosarcinales archaeon]
MRFGLTRWDPFRELQRIQERMNRLFEEYEPSAWRVRREVYTPLVDVIDRKDEIVVTADMPGVDKKNIEIRVHEDLLEISAKRGEDKEEGYVRRERSYDKFYRALRLPSAVDESKAKASFNNGVLEVRLPKLEIEKKKKIQVE